MLRSLIGIVRDWILRPTLQQSPRPDIRLQTRRLFTPSNELLERLWQRERAQYGAVETSIPNELLLDPGLGPATYLTRDGRIVWYDGGWGIKGTYADAFAAVIAGVGKTKVEELLELLPRRDDRAHDCSKCSGSGWWSPLDDLAKDERVDVDHHRWICMTCGGLGWISSERPPDEVVLEIL